jgi:hypothetical protein
MIVELILADGVGRSAPLRLEANQLIVRNEQGTPICVAAVFGIDRAIAVSKAGDHDFTQMLRQLGVHDTVIVDKLVLPKPPPGATLIAGPRN